MTNIYDDYLYILEALCRYRDWGIYDAVTRGMTELGEDDIFELYELGLDNAAPFTSRDDIPMGGDDSVVTAEEIAQVIENGEKYECDHYHTVYSFSSPEMREYYRLCRLYERREGIEPKDNPYVMSADAHYVSVLRMINGQFAAGFDSEIHTTSLYVETCPEWQYDTMEIIWTVRKTLDYYTEHLVELQREMARTPFVFLPVLPERTKMVGQSELSAIHEQPERPETAPQSEQPIHTEWSDAA
jgi:hypothetical protein